VTASRIKAMYTVCRIRKLWERKLSSDSNSGYEWISDRFKAPQSSAEATEKRQQTIL